jgi:hypothetical protein
MTTAGRYSISFILSAREHLALFIGTWTRAIPWRAGSQGTAFRTSLEEGVESFAFGYGAYVLQVGRNNRITEVTCQEQHIYIKVLLWRVINQTTDNICCKSAYTGRNSRFKSGIFPQWVRKLQSKRNKSFALSSNSVEERMQNIRTDAWGVWGMSDDLAQICFDLDCKFVSFCLWPPPRGLSESPDNSTFLGTHSGF